MPPVERPYLHFPRPTTSYYEIRSEYLSQGDLSSRSLLVSSAPSFSTSTMFLAPSSIASRLAAE